MAKLYSTDQPIFLGRAHRLDIAFALTERPLTIGECARQLGVSIGLIYRPLLAMHEAGQLESDGNSIDRGTRFWLRPELVECAETEAREGQPVGKLLPDQTVLLVECPRLLDLALALFDAGLSRCVLWVTELDAGNRFLLVLDRRNTSAVAHGRLRSAIEAAGGVCQSARSARILDGAGWRNLLASVRDAASQ